MKKAIISLVLASAFMTAGSAQAGLLPPGLSNYFSNPANTPAGTGTVNTVVATNAIQTEMNASAGVLDSNGNPLCVANDPCCELKKSADRAAATKVANVEKGVNADQNLQSKMKGCLDKYSNLLGGFKLGLPDFSQIINQIGSQACAAVDAKVQPMINKASVTKTVTGPMGTTTQVNTGVLYGGNQGTNAQPWGGIQSSGTAQLPQLF